MSIKNSRMIRNDGDSALTVAFPEDLCYDFEKQTICAVHRTASAAAKGEDVKKKLFSEIPYLKSGRLELRSLTQADAPGLQELVDSEIVYLLLQAIREHRRVDLSCYVMRRGELREHTVLPLKIFVSTQSGRNYLLSYNYQQRRPMFFRMDNIRRVKPGDPEPDADRYAALYQKAAKNMWGVSTGTGHTLDHVEMTVHVGKNEGFILDRLEREKRCGSVEAVDEHTVRYAADVYDAAEMLPWIRTFTGRIVRFECSDEFTRKRFYEDLETMRALYGGETDAVQ